jgi:hypothetical protein
MVELVLISDANELLVWNMDASYDNGMNTGRFLVDNTNSGILPPLGVPTDVNDDPLLLPLDLILHQNYPNPFNPLTTIRFDLPMRSEVSLSVYNILGQKVATVIDRPLQAGKHEIEYDASNLASGVYFYRLKTGESAQTKKMLLVK